MLNIWGVMLFLRSHLSAFNSNINKPNFPLCVTPRLTWVIGQAGIIEVRRTDNDIDGDDDDEWRMRMRIMLRKRWMMNMVMMIRNLRMRIMTMMIRNQKIRIMLMIREQMMRMRMMIRMWRMRIMVATQGLLLMTLANVVTGITTISMYKLTSFTLFVFNLRSFPNLLQVCNMHQWPDQVWWGLLHDLQVSSQTPTSRLPEEHAEYTEPLI